MMIVVAWGEFQQSMVVLFIRMARLVHHVLRMSRVVWMT